MYQFIISKLNKINNITDYFILIHTVILCSYFALIKYKYIFAQQSLLTLLREKPNWSHEPPGAPSPIAHEISATPARRPRQGRRQAAKRTLDPAEHGVIPEARWATGRFCCCGCCLSSALCWSSDGSDDELDRLELWLARFCGRRPSPATAGDGACGGSDDNSAMSESWPQDFWLTVF